MKPIIAVLITAILWSLLWIVGKYALNLLWRFDITAWRVFFTLLLLIPVIHRFVSWKFLGSIHFWIIGILWFLNVIVFMYAIQYTTAGMAQLLYLSIPFFVIVLNILILWVFPKKIHLIGMMISTIWIFLFVSDKITDISGVTLLWNWLVLLAAFFHSVYIVYSKKFQHTLWLWTRISGFAISSVIITIVLAPNLSSFNIPDVSTFAVTFLLWLLSLWLHIWTQFTNDHFGSLVSSSVLYIQPFIWLILAYTILWETTSMYALIWWLISVIGAYLLSR